MTENFDVTDAEAGPACVHERVTAQACATPHAVAVTCGKQQINYSDLDARANHVAELLLSSDVRQGSLVAICIDRSIEMVIAMLGILKAGAAYLPVATTDPPERIASLLAEAGVAVVLSRGTQFPAEARTGFRGEVIDLAAVTGARSSAPAVASPPSDLAYVIFTSGSTGRPKGVAMTHAPLVNLLRWQRLSTARNRARGARVAPALAAGHAHTLQFTPLTFDVSFLEIFSALQSGGTVVVPTEDERRDVNALLDLMQRHEVASVFLPLVALNQIAEAGVRRHVAPRSLVEIMTGGEQLRITPQIAAWFAQMPQCTLQNIYGPTEAHVVTTHELHGDPSTWPALPPIGRAIPNVELHLLDRELRPVAAGEVGELYIGGICLAREYLGRPELTAERFIASPFGAGRLYRTGDLAHVLPDGAIMYDGRTDDQVKIQGVRIELGEIETVLERHPEVSVCAVTVREDQAEGKRLVAYIVPRGQPPAQPVTLHMPPTYFEYLAARLPDAMVPRSFVVMPALPTTSSGKVERKALPAPATARPALQTAFVAPATALERMIADTWRRLLAIDEVGVDDSFFELGGRSLLLVQIQNQLASALGRELSLVSLFDNPTVRSLARFLGDGPEPAAREAPAPAPGPGGDADIAIIGVACRFPDAADVDAFWRNLAAARSSIRQLAERELEAPPRVPGADGTVVRAAAVLDDIEMFDAAFFGYTGREAEVMDPQQRIFLECAWEAFEDAGYPPLADHGSVGVYAGSGINTYLLNNVHPARGYTAQRSFLESMGDMQLMFGNEKDFVTTRVSYKLDLHGPSVNVQAACATSLVAIHLACRALRAGECELALAGCSTIRLPQRAAYVHEPDLVFSPDGHTRAFDARAQGTTFGSGAGAVLLKPLHRALADGDPIRAVIKGSAINNDGARKVGFTAVSVAGQAEVVRAALRSANVAADTIGYVEAHGTGTAMGDPVEVAALTRAFASERRQFCAIGTVKTNLGHLSWSAGMAGLLKTVLALQHRQIPASLHFERANPHIDFERSPFFVNTSLADWPAGETPRRAGVSAFGLGGANAHVVLEEAPARAASGAAMAAGLLVLSGKSPAAVQALAARYAAYLDGHPDAALADVCFTAAVGRNHFEHRAALPASSRAQLTDALRELAQRGTGIAAAPSTARTVAFLFTGQGSQYEGMGRHLYDTVPVFRDTIDACARVVAASWPVSLHDVMFGDGGHVHDMPYTQAAMFAFECALAQTWIAWGVEPAWVMGHSTGEYAAACVAGVFSLEDGMRLSAERGRLFAELVPATGKMATVIAAEPQVLRAIEPFAREVAIAAVNGPLSTVIAGEASAVDAASARLAAEGCDVRPLRVQRAGHAPMTEPVLEPLRRLFEGVTLAPPRLPLISNVTGALAGAEVATPAYWVRHTRQTVRFADGVTCAADQGAGIFLEIGPDAALVGLSAFSLHGRDVAFVPSLRRPAQVAAVASDDGRALAGALRKLYQEGVAPAWSAVFGAGRQRVHLPTYPFQRQRYWIDPPALVAAPSPVAGLPDGLLEIHWALTAPPARARVTGTWLVVGDADGLADRVEAAVRAAGGDVVRASDGHDAFAHVAGPLAGVLYLAGAAPVVLDADAPAEPVWAACAGLLALAQRAVGRDPIPPRLWVVTRGAQAVRDGDQVEGLAASPLWAMARVIGMEHPELRCMRVDLDAASAHDAGQVVAELASDGAHDAVAWRAGERWVARLRRHVPPPGAAERQVAVRGDASYLVTGGLGGVGLVIARWLVAQGARRLVLAGRSSPSAEAAAAFAALEATGAEIVIARGDVTQRADVEQLIAISDHPERPLRGIVHSAGVLDDGVMQQQDRERFVRVLAPKVAGAWHLHAAAARCAQPLELFVLMSSAASLLGNPGQINHAAGNAFLDGLAHHRRARGLAAISINWGAWVQAGALLRHDTARGRLDRLGFAPISTADGLAALGYAVALGRAQLGVAPMQWAKFVRECNVAQVAFFSELATSAGAGPVEDTIASRLRGAAAADVPAMLRTYVRGETAHVLGLAAGGQSLDVLADDRRLAEYGIDSLSSIELRNRLQAGLGVRLPATFLFLHPTIASMVSALSALPLTEAPSSSPSSSSSLPAPAASRPRGLSMQQRRWLSLIRGGYGQRVVPIVVYAELDPVALRAALLRVVERHELLRYAFPDDQVDVWPAERVIPPLTELVVDVRDRDADGRAQALAACVKQCWADMPDPARRPSWAVRCLSYPGKFVLLVSLQHLDFDGTSLTTFTQELRAAYRAALAGDLATPLPPPATPYAAYVEWQRAYMSDSIREDRAFFQGLYASLQRTTALAGHAGFARTTAYESARYTPRPIPGLWAQVQARASQLAVTPFSVLLAAYAATVGHITQSGEVVIAMITNGRADPRFKDTIGPFTAPFPVKLSVTGAADAELAQQCSRIVAAIHARSAYPVADLTEHVPAFHGLPIDSYFTDVGINFTNYRREDEQQEPRVRVVEVLGPIEEPELAAANTEELRRIPGLHLVMDLVHDELRCNFWYHRHRFVEGQVRGWAERFLGQLHAIVEAQRAA